MDKRTIIEQVEVVLRNVEDVEGYEHTERKEWTFEEMSQVDVELTGTQANSVWFSDDQQIFERENADCAWEQVITRPELRRARVSLGMLTVRTNQQTVETMLLDGLARMLEFKAGEIIDTPEFPCGKDSNDLHIEGAGIVNEVLHNVTKYINTLQEAGLAVDDLIDQLYDAHDIVKEKEAA